MNKAYQLILPALLCSVPVLAAPFTALDARSMAMGETGVASSQAGSAALFNPALLSGKVSEDTVSIILPNVGVSVFADQDALDALENINDGNYLDNIDDALNILNGDSSTQEEFFAAKKTFTDNASGFNENLFDLSEQPINLNAGMFFAVSIPNETLGVSVFANVTAVVETVPVITECDQNILSGYIDYMDEINSEEDILISYPSTIACADGSLNFDVVDINTSDPNNVTAEITDPSEHLTSRVFIAGVTVAEFGVALSHAFDVGGSKISVGITPKMMQLTSYFAFPSIEDVEDPDFDFADEIEDNKKEDDDFNMDLGVSGSFLSESLTVGLVAKNIMAKTYTTAEYKGRSTSYDVDTQLRAGIAWHAPLGITLAADLDLIKNKPYFDFGDDTQYLGLGAEWDVFSFIRLRGGMKTNLDNSDDTAFTAGLGLNIVAVHIDLAAQVSENNAGAALQFGLEF